MTKHLTRYITVAVLLVLFQSTLSGQKSGTLLSDTINVLNYEIHLDVSDFSNQTIAGYTVITLHSNIDNIVSIPLELLDLSIDSVRINTPGFSASAFDYDGNIITIHSATALQKTDTIDVLVAYHGHPTIDPTGWGGFTFQSGVAFNLGVGFGSDPHNLGKTWFPCIDDFVDRASYEYFITTTNDKMAVAGGVLASSYFANADSSKTTYQWVLDEEIPTYLASIAIANYTEVLDTIIGIDAAIPVGLYVQPQYQSLLQGSFIHLEDALHAFEARFGPYQWPRIGYVNTPVGAMEHTANIAYPNSLINGNTDYETTMAHELAHAWFGNLITCETAEDMWINEGWASYCEAIFTEHVYGNEAYKSYVRQNHTNNLRTLQHTEGWLPLYGIGPEHTYSSTVYDKGADMVHTMRGYLGDELFFELVKNLLADSAYNDVSSEEMRDYLSIHSGIDMTGFFDAYIFSPGWVHFSIDSMTVVPTPGLNEVTVYVRQRMKAANALAQNNRLEVTFLNDDWLSQTETILFDGATGSQTFSLPFVPSAAILDMEERIADATTDSYRVLSEPGSGTFNNVYFKYEIINISDSALLRVEQNWIAPDGFINNHPDMILSQSRYWKVDGIFPSNFETKFKFNYNNKTGGEGWLDDGWFPYPLKADSLVLLYREGPGYEWNIIDSEKAGTSRNGYLVTEFNQKGEYTLAYKDASLAVIEESLQHKNILKVFPNPAKQQVSLSIDYPSEGAIIIYDGSGKQVHIVNKKRYQRRIKINLNSFAPGTYIVQFIAKSVKVADERLIITK